MSFLALLTASENVTVPEPPAPWTPPEPFPVTVPGVPTSAPYADTKLICDIPSYDGYDQMLHPSVVDFGGKWKGYRFWMVATPYPRGTGLSDGAPDTHENPSIYASNDCLTWTPIGPQPLIKGTDQDPTLRPGFYSDNEMAWDPDTARFELWWRGNHGGAQHVWHMHGDDPTTGEGQGWSTRTGHITSQTGAIGWMSPVVARLGPGRWRMWDYLDTADGKGRTMRYADATTPEGPWSTPAECGVVGDVDIRPKKPWHGGVARRASDGTLFTLTMSYVDNKTYAGTSTDDGATWKWSATAAFDGGYRPFPVLHENGTHMRVWYSRNLGDPPGGLGWKTYYTELPLTAFPS